MGTPKEQPKPLPPYVSYRTFLNFVASQRQGMPGRIDRTLMSNLSGAIQSQLFGTLRYLNLINQQDIPQTIFEKLAKAEGAEQQEVLREVLQSSYPFLFDTEGFNLANATPGQFEEQFRKAGASGDTIRKCTAFFLAAAKDAEIPISPRITSASRPRTTSARPNRQNGDTSAKKNGEKTRQQRTPDQGPTQAPSDATSTGNTKRVLPLTGGETLTLSVTGNLFTLARRDRNFVFRLLDLIEEHEQGESSDESPSNDDVPF